MKKILFVEDEASLQVAVGQSLKKAGFEVDIAKVLIVTNQNYSDWLHDAVMNHLTHSLEEVENASSV